MRERKRETEREGERERDDRKNGIKVIIHKIMLLYIQTERPGSKDHR